LPFINHVLDANQKTLDEQKARQRQVPATRYLFNPEGIVSELTSLIIGQDEVIEQLGSLLFRVKADIVEPSKPLLVLMLLGPTGVGKTQLVNHLARIILGSEKSLCRVDMNTLSQSHYSAALTGAPPGYAGSKENHTLFNADAISGSYSRPGIVLFDEIEKASQDVCRSLLNVLDNAQLILSSGNKTIDFSNSLIFMTTNIGSDAMLEKAQFPLLSRVKKWIGVRSKSPQEEAFQVLKNHFEPEFLNRIEDFLYFQPLDNSNLNSLIEIELAAMHKRINREGYEFTFTKACNSELKKQYQKEYGARNIRHRIRKDIEPMIARCLLNSSIQSSQYIVDWQGKFIVSNNSCG
jgi:ATP-dependent Clp protease ATP-binding subunit ClpA